MAEWGSLARTPGQDFVSMFMSKSKTPVHSGMNGNIPELVFSPSPTKNTGETEDLDKSGCLSTGFCNRSNLDPCVAFLNQEVTLLGMQSLYDSQRDTFDIVRLVNITHELLLKHQRSSRLREELELRQHRSASDITQLQGTVGRLKTQLEQQHRELAKLQEKERQVAIKNKQLASKLKAEKEEVKRLQSVIQSRDAQFKHEQKKKEREHAKLKDRLNQLLTDKCREKKIGIEISQLVQKQEKVEGKRGKWPSGKRHEEELYRTVISNYESQQKTLLLENTELRECLQTMQKELIALLHESNSTSPNKSQSLADDDAEMSGSDEGSIETMQSTEDVSEGHFQMPYDMVRDVIQKSLKEKYKMLKRHIRGIEKKRLKAGNSENGIERTRTLDVKDANTDNQREITKLKQQIENYHSIVEQQELLIQKQSLEAQQEVADNCLIEDTDTELFEDREGLDRARDHFYQQKEHFNQERKTFTEAASRLDQERKKFEEEKTKYLQEQFFHMTPFVADTRAKNFRRHRFLPVTPGLGILSPTPGQILDVGSSPDLNGESTPFNPPKNQLPSTVELYRTIGLAHPDASQKPVNGSRSSPAMLNHDSMKSPNGPLSPARVAEHVENVKMALFKKQQEEEPKEDT